MKKWSEQGSSDEEEEEITDTTSKELVAENLSYFAQVNQVNFKATEQDVNNFFSTNGCNINHLELLLGGNGKPTGSAIIEFSDLKSLDICISLNNAVFLGRKIVTQVFSTEQLRQENQREENQRNNDYRQNNYNDNGRGGRYRDNRGGERVRENQDYRSNNSNRDGNQRDGNHNRNNGRRSDHNNNDRGYGRQNQTQNSASVVDEPPPPAVRPKIIIQPRTLPVETIGVPIKPSGIFGEGKPQDVSQYEERKKQMLLEKQLSASSDSVEQSAPITSRTPSIDLSSVKEPIAVKADNPLPPPPPVNNDIPTNAANNPTKNQRNFKQNNRDYNEHEKREYKGKPKINDTKTPRDYPRNSKQSIDSVTIEDKANEAVAPTGSSDQGSYKGNKGINNKQPRPKANKKPVESNPLPPISDLSVADTPVVPSTIEQNDPKLTENDVKNIDETSADFQKPVAKQDFTKGRQTNKGGRGGDNVSTNPQTNNSNNLSNKNKNQNQKKIPETGKVEFVIPQIEQKEVEVPVVTPITQKTYGQIVKQAKPVVTTKNSFGFLNQDDDSDEES
eukprot:gene5000-6985_t